MNWVHSIIDGVMACCCGVLAYYIGWRSLAQEMRLGKVENLRWQAARIVGTLLVAVNLLWKAVASPKSGSTAEYIWWGVQILAIAAIVYGVRARRASGSR